MLPYRLDQFNANVFEEIVRQKWQEGSQVDFKRELGNDNRSRVEFLKDVCAFANHEGGDIVVGIAEADGCADAIVPLSTAERDGFARRLGQIADSSIEPRVHGVEVRTFDVPGGMVAVIRVPASFDGPHSFAVNEARRFVIRNNTHSSDMTYDQIRSAFGQRETLLERAAIFRTQRLDRTPDPLLGFAIEGGAKFVVHIVPLMSLTRRSVIDIRRIDATYYDFILPDWKRGATSWTTQSNLNGLAILPAMSPRSKIDVPCYAHLFRNGCFETVRWAWPLGQDDTTRINGVAAGIFLRETIQLFFKKAQHIGISGPALVSLSLVEAAGTSLFVDYEKTVKLPVTRIEIPAELVQDIAASPDIDDVSRPILEVLYQAYGQTSCPLFDESGRWKNPSN